MVINWRNVNAPNQAASNELRANAVRGLTSSLKNLGGDFNKAHQRNVTADVTAFKDVLAGANLDNIGNVDTSNLGPNVSRSQAENLLNTRRSNLQNAFSQADTFQQKKQTIADRDSVQQFGADIANLQNRGQTNDVAANINSSNISGSAKTKLINQLNTKGVAVQTQADNDRLRGAQIKNLNESEQSEALIKSTLTQVGPVLTADSRNKFDTVVNENLAAFNQEVGGNVTAQINPQTGQVEFGNTEGVNPETLNFLSEDLNTQIDALGLKTESNANTLRESLRTNTNIDNDTNEASTLLDSFDKAAANRNELRGTDKDKFNQEVRKLEDTETFTRNGLEAKVTSLNKTITNPMPLNKPQGKRAAIKEVSDIVEKLSDSWGTSWFGVAGNDAVVAINTLMDAPFTVKIGEGSKERLVTVDPSQLSGDMYTTALLVIHDRNNTFNNEGIDLDAYKKQIALYSENQDGFNKDKTEALALANEDLADFNLTASEAMFNEKLVAEDKIRQNRDVSKNAKSLFKFLPTR